MWLPSEIFRPEKYESLWIEICASGDENVKFGRFVVQMPIGMLKFYSLTRWGVVMAFVCWPRFRMAAIAGLVVVLAAFPADAARRVALVVGNSDYQHVVRLANPANDARLIAKTLRDLGFTLVDGGAQIDLDKSQFDHAVQAFRNAAKGADVALFYYGGHGLQVNGVNYLVPIDADLHQEADVDFQMLDTGLIMRQMESARARLNLLILDACRNNPFGSRGLRAITGGLAQMQAPEGTLISFATQPGNVALDGSGGHSPFSKALAEVMRRPGLDIFRTFNQVGVMVSKATDRQQQPWLSSSPISGDFYFAGKPAAPKPDAAAEERRRYDAAQRIDTKKAWGLFLSTYKTGYYADLARAERDKIAAIERAKLADEERARIEAKVQAHAAALDKARREAAAKSAKETLDKVQRETAAAKAAQQAAKAAQLAAEKAARELQAAIEKVKQEAAADKEKPLKTRTKVASLTPPSSAPAASGLRGLDHADIVRLLKIHLRQVGCDPGDLSGVWDSGSRRALKEFNEHAGTHLDIKVASVDTLDAVQAKHGRICPLVCGSGTRRKGDQCVAIACKHGYALGANGKCERTKRSREEAEGKHHNKAKAGRNATSGRIIKGSARHFELQAGCRAGKVASCRALCSGASWAWRACRHLSRLTGQAGSGYGHHHGISRGRNFQ